MTKQYKITISQKIKDYRKENCLSLSDFGGLIGVSAQAVYKWEQEKCYPDIIFLPHLAEILGCKTDDFFAPSGDKKGGEACE